jgi:hypothetical protein
VSTENSSGTQIENTFDPRFPKKAELSFFVEGFPTQGAQ